MNCTYHVIELTVCFETNMFKSHEYKAEKYKNIDKNVIDKNAKIILYPIELSCLGFTSKNMVKFSKLVRTANININRLLSKCSEVCCRTTYYVYNRRGKSWSAPPTMKYT